MKIKKLMLLHVDYVVADKLFCLQSVLEIKNSSEGDRPLKLQFTFKTLIESWSTF
jgi:hypothetical protein